MHGFTRRTTLGAALLLAVAVPTSAAAALAGSGGRQARSLSLTVSVASPSNGSTVSGGIVWQAAYGSLVPTRVDFALDGKLVASDSSAPFRYGGDAGLLDTTALANGSHTLAVTAYRSYAKATAAVTVTVSNSPTPPPSSPPPSSPPPSSPPPAPALTATAADSAHVQLSWTALAGAATYQISRDGTLVGQTAGTSFSDALLWPSTSYSYRVDGIGANGSKVGSVSASATTVPLPASGFPRPFAASSFWNTPVGTTQPAADSAAIADYFAAHALYPNMTLHSWGVPVAEARSSDPTYQVPCTVYTSCTLGAFGAFPIPLTAAPDPAADGHLAVVDPAAGREWDMWQARRSGDSWSASAGAAVSTSGTGVAPAGTESGDAANFPLLGGLVRPEEILQGHIDHALVFGMPGVSKAGNVCPATHHDGSSTDPSAPQEGAHLQLDPAVDVDALPIPQWEKTIAHALQTYGMYLRDESGSLAIWAENPIARGYDAWAKVGLTGDSISLAGIPWDRFRVLQPPC